MSYLASPLIRSELELNIAEVEEINLARTLRKTTARTGIKTTAKPIKPATTKKPSIDINNVANSLTGGINTAGQLWNAVGNLQGTMNKRFSYVSSWFYSGGGTNQNSNSQNRE